MKQRKVVVVQRSLRRYREAFYERLRADMADHNIELVLLHGNVDRDEREDAGFLPWAVHHQRREVAIAGRRLIWQPGVGLLRGADLVIVEQASRLIMNYLLLLARPLGGPRVAFWGHGVNFDAHSQRLGETLKRWLSRQPHWWFAYTDAVAGIVERTGYPRARITVVRNSTDTTGLARRLEATDDERVNGLCQELDLRGDCVGLFLGSLEPQKRFDYLFAAADVVHQRLPHFELVLAGSGGMESSVREQVAARPWARYAGHRIGAEQATLLRLARLLLVPCWAGLIVVDSFAAGVPLVASRSLPHPPEVDYISSGVDGVRVDDGGDPAVYAAAVVELLEDEERRRRLVDGALATAEGFGVEQMVARFTHGVERALSGS